MGSGGAVADPVMAVPIDQNLGLVLAVRSKQSPSDTGQVFI